MKKLFGALACLWVLSGLGQTPCESGFAGSYPCEGYDLLAHLNLSDLDANLANDSWGWTDPTTGREYAHIGLDNGTAFIDVTNLIQTVKLIKS